jgi:hypothetical protein
MSVISVLEALHVLPIWCDIGLDTVIQYARLVSHLKQDILLPQPVDQSVDKPPEILPPTIAKFLALAMGIPVEHMQAGWDVLKGYLWSCLKVPLVDEDYEAFKVFGWQLGLSSY